jgi:hypothetical protein
VEKGNRATDWTPAPEDTVQFNSDYNGLTFDPATGLTVNTASNTLTMSGAKGIELKKGDSNIFSLDASGNLAMSGNISGSNISGSTFSASYAYTESEVWTDGNMFLSGTGMSFNESGYYPYGEYNQISNYIRYNNTGMSGEWQRYGANYRSLVLDEWGLTIDGTGAGYNKSLGFVADSEWDGGGTTLYSLDLNIEAMNIEITADYDVNVNLTTNTETGRIGAFAVKGGDIVSYGDTWVNGKLHVSTDGIHFPNDPWGGSGDTANIRLEKYQGTEDLQLVIDINNDLNDRVVIGSQLLVEGDMTTSFQLKASSVELTSAWAFIDFKDDVNEDFDMRIGRGGNDWTMSVEGADLVVQHGQVMSASLVLGTGTGGQYGVNGSLWYGNGYAGVGWYTFYNGWTKRW